MGLLYGRIKNEKGKKLVSKIWIYIILLLGSALCLIPFIWMVRSSLMTSAQIFFEMPPKNGFRILSNGRIILKRFPRLPFDRYFFKYTDLCSTGSCGNGIILFYQCIWLDQNQVEIPECCFQYNYFQYDASVCSNADSSLCHVVQYWNYQQLIASDYSLLVRRSIFTFFLLRQFLPFYSFRFRRISPY